MVGGPDTRPLPTALFSSHATAAAGRGPGAQPAGDWSGAGGAKSVLRNTTEPLTRLAPQALPSSSPLLAHTSPLLTTASGKNRRRAWRRLQPPLLAAGPAAVAAHRRGSPGPASSSPWPCSRPSTARRRRPTVLRGLPRPSRGRRRGQLRGSSGPQPEAAPKTQRFLLRP